MSSCAITIAGSSGTIEIRYTLNAETNVILAQLGDPIVIDDSATNVTACTLVGDLTASSGCLSISSLSLNYWQVDWQLLAVSGDTLSFDALFIDFDEIDFDSPIALASGNNLLGCSINGLNNYFITAVAKKTAGSDKYLILAVKGAGYPQIRIRNIANTHNMWLDAIPADGPLPDTFTAITNYTDCVN